MLTPFDKIKNIYIFSPPPILQIQKKAVTLHVIFALANVCLKFRYKTIEMNQFIHTTSSARPVEIVSGSSSTQSTGGWSSLSVQRTTSFTGIHQEVSQTVSYSPGHTHKAYNPAEEATKTLFTEQPSGPRRNNTRPGTPGGSATGQEEFGSPVGDMLLPLLAMAAAYIIIKLFRNRKTSQAL